MVSARENVLRVGLSQACRLPWVDGKYSPQQGQYYWRHMGGAPVITCQGAVEIDETEQALGVWPPRWKELLLDLAWLRGQSPPPRRQTHMHFELTCEKNRDHTPTTAISLAGLLSSITSSLIRRIAITRWW